MIDWGEICKILVIHGRKDLAEELKDFLDEDYKPPRRIKKEKLSDDEGSAEEEDLNYIIDKDGFYSLK